MQMYQGHERSREHIELAFERIMRLSFQSRQKKGFRAGRGKRGERARHEEAPTAASRLRALLDPSVTVAVAVRECVSFVAIGLWSAFTAPVNTAAVLVAFGYATFRSTSRRKIRNPDGPYFGDSPVFGAVLKVVLCMLAANLIGGALAVALPWPRYGVLPDQVTAFCLVAFLGPLNLMFK